MNFAEKRKSERKFLPKALIKLIPLDPQVLNKFSSKTECDIKDLSLVGVGINCYDKIPIGMRVSIDLVLGKNMSNVRVFGKVAWIHKENGKYRVGVSFSWWRDYQDRKIVTEIVENHYFKN